MSIDVGRVLREGVERTLSRNGLTFAALGYVVAVLGWAVTGSLPGLFLSTGGLGPLAGPGAQTPAVELPPSATVAAVVGLLLAGAAIVAAALRTFAAEEVGRIPAGRFTRNYPWMVANLAVGWVVQVALVGGLWTLILGLFVLGVLGVVSGGGWAVAGLVAVVVGLLLVVPALLVVEGLYFWYVFAIVEDRGFVTGFRHSWAVVEGNRAELFFVGVLVWVANTLLTGVGIVPALLLGGPAGFLVGQVAGAVAGVFTLATTARTYVQLVEQEADGEEAADGVAAEERERRRTRALETELETRGP